MKTRQSAQSAYFNLHTLIGLAAVGIVLTAVVVYGAGRTGISKPQRQWLPSGPAPQGSVTEAWVRRINGPASGSDHGHDVATDATGNIYVTGWIEISAGNADCYTVKYSSDGDVIWADTYAGSATAPITAMRSQSTRTGMPMSEDSAMVITPPPSIFLSSNMTATVTEYEPSAGAVR